MKRYRFIFLLFFVLALAGCGDGSGSSSNGGNGGNGGNAGVQDIPLCFTSTGSTTVSIQINGTLDNIPQLEYSKDGSTWTPIVLKNDDTVKVSDLSDGEKVYLRAQNTNNSFSESGSKYMRFVFADSGTIAASGNIMSLLDKSLSSTKIPCAWCFSFLFYNCSALTSAPALPATNLADYCYSYMFEYCTNLIAAPALPAETLSDSCYLNMFMGCTNLTTALVLPAKVLAINCYKFMFYGCSSLATAPDLPATTLADCCYATMFMGCTNLTTAPNLPATELAYSCYAGMLSKCTSLETAPDLPATTLADKCYSQMFYGCTSLNYLKVSFESWDGFTDPTYWWVKNVNGAGTFICPAALVTPSPDFGDDRIPAGWTVNP